MKVPEAVKWIVDRLNQAGFEAFIVGGCVRDLLMGREPKDWDITTSAKPEQVKGCFSKTFDTGIAHGTVTVVIEKKNYEVTTYRIDGEYMDYRRPETVYFTDRLNEDLMRRDFTINAIAYHPSVGYVDLYGGQADIQKKLVRGIGDPEQRFQEDALRMLRGIRFAAQFNFELEAETLQAMYACAHLIAHISIERIRDEFSKILLAAYPERISMMYESGLMTEVDPELAQHYQKSGARALRRLSLCRPVLTNRLALYFLEMDLSALERLLKFMRYDNRTVKECILFVEQIWRFAPDSDYGVRSRLAEMGPQWFEQTLYLKGLLGELEELEMQNIGLNSTAYEKIHQRYLAIMERGDCYTLKTLNISGNDLKRMGMTDGKMIGSLLRTLLDEVLKSPKKNSVETLHQMAETYLAAQKFCTEKSETLIQG